MRENPSGSCAWDGGGGRLPDVDLEGDVVAAPGVGAATLAADRWKMGHPVDGGNAAGVSDG
jgi:hypothetical protein